jgi:HTH-type transcriptional regulator / antitoxin HigA
VPSWTKRAASPANPTQARFVPALRALCASAGVAVVLVPGLPKTGLSGATRWLNPDKALIQLSLRYKSNDHLWFTFFHEAGHILLHGKKELFLEGRNGMDEKKEHEANVFARDRLIPPREFTDFVRQADFSQEAITRLAESIGIAPGIVVGRLQHEDWLPHSHCNALKIFYDWK